MTRETTICAAVALAAALLLAPGTARADCGWSIALLNKELNRIEEAPLLARAAGENISIRVAGSLGNARSIVARAQALNNTGDTGACERAIDDAREAANQARDALAASKKGRTPVTEIL